MLKLNQQHGYNQNHWQILLVGVASLAMIGIAQADTVVNTYDALNRITKIQYGNGMVVEYVYDPAGNRTQRIVTNSNQAPVANAGANKTAEAGALVMLDGTASADPDGGPAPLTYAWTQTAGQTVSLTNGTSATPSFTPPQSGSYEFSLTVSDGAATSAPSTVTVTVSPANIAPIANAGTGLNVVVGKLVNLNGMASSDPDGGPATLTFDWQQTVGPTVALTNPASATPSFTPTEPGSYTFSLVVYDGQSYSTPATVTYLAQIEYALTVSVTGSGAVASHEQPAYINCPGSCASQYADGSNVTLTATPQTGHRFVGWGGACSGVAVSCQVNVNQAKTVTASFAPIRKDSLALDFSPYGTWLYGSDGKWTKLHDLGVNRWAAGDVDGNGQSDLAVDFGNGIGVYLWKNRQTWQALHPLATEAMLAADLDGNGKSDWVFNFGQGTGLWAWLNGQEWRQLHTLPPRGIVAASLNDNAKADLAVDFAPYGLWRHADLQDWDKQFDGLSFQVAAVGDFNGNGQDDLAFGFGASGLWLWLDHTAGAWSQLHPMSPLDMTACDLDGNGKQDLVINFGYGTGLWVWRNNAQWQQLHTLPPQAMACANLDANAQQDLAVDFAPYGLWLYKNQAWEKLGDLPAKHILALPE